MSGWVGIPAATPLSEYVQWLGVHGMRWEDHIAIDPAVRGGQPVVRGTRVPVDVILGALAAGQPPEDLCQAYALGEEQIRDCLAFAADEIADGRTMRFLIDECGPTRSAGCLGRGILSGQMRADLWEATNASPPAPARAESSG